MTVEGDCSTVHLPRRRCRIYRRRARTRYDNVEVNLARLHEHLMTNIYFESAYNPEPSYRFENGARSRLRILGLFLFAFFSVGQASQEAHADSLADLSRPGADWGVYVDNGLVNPGEAVRMIVSVPLDTAADELPKVLSVHPRYLEEPCRARREDLADVPQGYDRGVSRGHGGCLDPHPALLSARGKRGFDVAPRRQRWCRAHAPGSRLPHDGTVLLASHGPGRDDLHEAPRPCPPSPLRRGKVGGGWDAGPASSPHFMPTFLFTKAVV